MRKKLIPFLLMVMMASFGSCVGDDIDDLQGQIDDLNTKVDDLEESQQAALLDEIAALQATIAALQASMEEGDSDLADQYATLLNNLQLLEDEVANNESAVYYGSLLTDDEFAAFLDQGATIVTGKVVVTSQSHIDAIADMKMVGGNLILSGGTVVDLAALQSVGGDLSITGLSTADLSVSLPALASVGGGIHIYENSGLANVTVDALIFVYGELSSNMNTSLQSLSFAALDQIGGIDINGYDESFYGAGTLSSVELSSANVNGDVYFQYVAGGALSLGNVEGSLTVDYTSITDLSITGQVVDGDFNFTNNGAIVSMDVASLTTINGGINISYNGGGGGGGWSASTTDFSTAFPAFENLETINGNITISGNSTNSIEAFNNVTTFKGEMIDISSNGSEVELLSVFNSLEAGGTSSYRHVNINVYGNYAWFSSFGTLQKAGTVELNVSPTMDPSTYEYDTNLRIDGFDALIQATSVNLYTPKVTSFSAFASLDHLTGWNTDLKVEMPEDVNVGLCSMEPFFTKYNADPTKYVVEFNQGWGNTLDPADAIYQLLAPCTN